MALEIHFDGASRGNPGPAAAGVVIREQQNHAEAINAVKEGLLEVLSDASCPEASRENMGILFNFSPFEWDERFDELINDPAFVEKFGSLRGDKNKRLPKEFREFQEVQPLIANKQFYYMAEMQTETVLKEDVLDFVTEYFKTGQSFNQFLLEALV